jgi:hypothetical protein
MRRRQGELHHQIEQGVARQCQELTDRLNAMTLRQYPSQNLKILR